MSVFLELLCCPQSTSYPEQKVVTVGQFKIGLTHGHQVVPWGDIESLAMVRNPLSLTINLACYTYACIKLV